MSRLLLRRRVVGVAMLGQITGALLLRVLSFTSPAVGNEASELTEQPRRRAGRGYGHGTNPRRACA